MQPFFDFLKSQEEFTKDTLISKLPNKHIFRYLNFNQSRVTDEGLQLFGQLDMTRILRLNQCNLISDVGLRLLNAPSLVSLNLSRCRRITDLSLELIAKNLIHLKSLNLSDLRITDSGVFFLRDLKLMELDLSRTQVTSSSVDVIVRHNMGTSICELQLVDTEMSDLEVFVGFSECPCIKKINLGGTRLSLEGSLNRLIELVNSKRSVSSLSKITRGSLLEFKNDCQAKVSSLLPTEQEKATWNSIAPFLSPYLLQTLKWPYLKNEIYDTQSLNATPSKSKSSIEFFTTPRGRNVRSSTYSWEYKDTLKSFSNNKENTINVQHSNTPKRLKPSPDDQLPIPSPLKPLPLLNTPSSSKRKLMDIQFSPVPAKRSCLKGPNKNLLSPSIAALLQLQPVSPKGFNFLATPSKAGEVNTPFGGSALLSTRGRKKSLASPTKLIRVKEDEDLFQPTLNIINQPQTEYQSVASQVNDNDNDNDCDNDNRIPDDQIEDELDFKPNLKRPFHMIQNTETTKKRFTSCFKVGSSPLPSFSSPLVNPDRISLKSSTPRFLSSTSSSSPPSPLFSLPSSIHSSISDISPLNISRASDSSTSSTDPMHMLFSLFPDHPDSDEEEEETEYQIKFPTTSKVVPDSPLKPKKSSFIVPNSPEHTIRKNS
uniref:Uncharacterized protein n=1 Tax=Arcella intermedia TaxID=1963864 RepID=A0A6B2KZH2_9EUKA